MARVCALSGKKGLCGNKVSHANNKTKRRFMPNLQNVSLFSERLGFKIKTRLSTSSIRSIEKNGGIDDYLLKSNDSLLSPHLKSIKKILCRSSI
ncbi:MAG: 50S ribosomal protein L28 [Holosporaceae bacterium]|jgi:large subunit ribosomal protein L28|nr:50S ribosomal protein L28 [Holosporaceae bacterium]